MDEQVVGAERVVPVERVVAAVDRLWRSVGELGTGVRYDPGGSAFSLVSGLPMPTMNGVWATDTRAGADEVAGLLRAVADEGVPFCLQARESLEPLLAPVAESLGMALAEHVPLMVLPSASALQAPPDDPALRIRRLGPGETGAHCAVATAGFETPPGLFEAMMDVLAPVPGQRAFLGEVDGAAVTTALTVATVDDSVGVFNVATPPSQRGHGYGAAITAAAARDGLDAGATWSWLQSSAEGFGVYGRLGYRTVERWPLWVGGA